MVVAFLRDARNDLSASLEAIACKMEAFKNIKKKLVAPKHASVQKKPPHVAASAMARLLLAAAAAGHWAGNATPLKPNDTTSLSNQGCMKGFAGERSGAARLPLSPRDKNGWRGRTLCRLDRI